MRALAVLALLLTHAARAQAPAMWMPSSQIEPGMRGHGLATFHGADVAEYGFEVLDVVRGEAGAASALLVRLSGARVEEAGGIAQGMSGSPLYLDGKLAAALAYALPNSDPHYGYAIPIEASAGAFLGEAPIARLMPGPVAGARTVAASLPTPLLASAPVTQLASAGPLEPGSLVGIQIVRGGMHATTYGTVTAISGGRVLLLGHKYLHEGPCHYALVRAAVGAIVPSAKAPLLHANPLGEPIGTVVEDRGSGCVAELGAYRPMLPLTLRAQGDLGSLTLEVEVTPTPELFRESAASALIAVLDGVEDRVGPGSADLRLRIEFVGGVTVDRTEVVSSHRDIGGACAAELRALLDGTLANPWWALEARSCEVSATVRSEPSEAGIVDCTLSPARVRAGEQTTVTVTFAPRRAATESRQVLLSVPGDLEPGPRMVRCHAKACEGLLGYDRWESPGQTGSPSAWAALVSSSGMRSSLACDLLPTPVEALFGRLLGARLYDEGSELGVRDVPEREAPAEAPGLESLLYGTRPDSRALMATPWALRGEAFAELIVLP